MPRRPTAQRLVPTLAAGSLVILAAACGGAPPPASGGPAGAPIPVATATASVTTVADRLEAGGVIAADSSAAMASRVLAPVMDVRVRAGDRVHAGDVLVVLDDRDTAARAVAARAAASAADQGLAAAVSDRAAAEAARTLAAAWHTRIAALQAERAATSQELDEANARLSAASAQVDGAQARVAQATSQLAAARATADAAVVAQSFSEVRAPFDGLVTERLVDPGALASPGVPLLRLDSAGRPHVEARVDESRQQYLHVGDPVEVLIDNRAGGVSDAPLAGVVTEIARAVAADERAFTVKVSLPDGIAPRTGTFARVRFAGASRQALVIPATAVRREGQLSTAFVVTDGVAHLRLLRTGDETAGRVEVLAGLDRGEVIVNAPPPALVDGRHVTASPESVGGRQ